MKKIIIAVILLAALSGGGYWYLFMYQPSAFGKGIVEVYKKMQQSGDLLNEQNLALKPN